MKSPQEIEYEARKAATAAYERLEMAEAYTGLDSLLKGAWGTENLNGLGGGVVGIQKAHAVLGRLLVPKEEA